MNSRKTEELELKVPQRAVESLKAAFGERLVSVVLFGSRARGEDSRDSDWDLLVIAEELPPKHYERHLFLKGLLPTGCEGVSLLARTPREFEAHLSSICLDIALDGQIFYDPLGYATQKLSGLRQQIVRAGLFRERTEEGDFWRWEKAPPQGRTLKWEK